MFGQNWKFDAMASSQVMSLPECDRGPAHDVGQVRQRGAFGLVVRAVAGGWRPGGCPTRPARGVTGSFGARQAMLSALAALVLVSVHRALVDVAGELRGAFGAVEVGGEIRRGSSGSQRTTSIALVPSAKVHSMVNESRFWPQSVLLAARPPMPCADTGQASLIQQISSIWWMFISANSPPETQRKCVKCRICQCRSFSVRRALGQPAARLHPVGADELDVAQFAVADALDEFLAVPRMAALQAGGDLEVLLLRRFARLDHAPHAGRIGGERFLHEHIHAFLHGVFELPGRKPA